MGSRGDTNKEQIQPILKKEWEKIPFEKTLDETGSFSKLKTGELLGIGDFPVIDQGEKEIAGYINDQSLTYNGELPVIIFGDHTRNIKYVDFEFGVGADGTKILKPLPFLHPKFFFYYLKSLRIPSLGYSRHYSILKQLDVPIPNREEQKQISKKLDEIFIHLSVLNARLNRIPDLIKALKEKVLTYAITGILTEDWRKKNKLTKEWRIESAATCCQKVQSGGTPKKGVGFSSTGYPFLKVYNIVNQKIDFAYRPQFINSEAHNHALKKSICLPGDVLMNIVGPPLCKVAIVPDTYAEWNINQAITLFRPKEYLHNKFLYYFFCEGSSVKSVMPETRGVVGQINISLSQCREFSIPIPSFEEQVEIVRIVDSLFLLSNNIEKYYDNLKKSFVDLPEAILRNAFNGKLIGQLVEKVP